MNTIAQRRSLFALTELRKVSAGNQEKFTKLVLGLPAMILQNGLGQTLAFLLAKGKDEHRAAFDIVTAWLRNLKVIEVADNRNAVLSLSTIPQEDYLRGQEEALKVLEWVKRYANAGIF